MDNERPWIQSLGEHTPVVHERAYIHPRAVLIGQVVIGADSTVWPNVTLRGDDGAIVIGERTSIQDGTVIHSTEGLSETFIGDCVTVGHNAIIHGAKVSGHSIIGMGAILLDNVEVGEHCVIGAGAVVTQRTVIPPRSLVLGTPARVIRSVNEADLKAIEYGWRHYVKRRKQYLGESE